MAKYNVHAGHNKIVPGASKYLDEVTENRKVKNYAIQYLKQQDHTVYDCTDDKGTTQSKNLANIVAKCNKHSVKLDVSVHLNSGGGEGVEVLYVSSAGKEYAEKIAKEISKELDIPNRGAKKRTDLYVLNHTNSVAVIVECCFVDSKADKEAWNAKKCAKGMVKGITGKSVTEITKDENKETSAASSFLVKVSGVSKGDVLNIREKPDADSKKNGSLAYNDPNKYTIVQTKKNGSDTWGKLKSGIGWINLEYTKRV